MRASENIVKMLIHRRSLSSKSERVFTPEWNKAIMEEVDKLLVAGFIQEVYYPE